MFIRNRPEKLIEFNFLLVQVCLRLPNDLGSRSKTKKLLKKAAWTNPLI